MFVLSNMVQTVVIFDWMIYAAMLPSVARDLQLTHWQAGLPITVLLAVMAVTQLVGGALVDRAPEPLVSIAALAAAAVGGWLAATSHGIGVLVLSRAFNGLAAGLSFIAGMGLAARLFSGSKLALNMGIFGSMVNVGILASSLVAPLMEPVLGWRGVFGATTAVTIALIGLYPVVNRHRTELRQPLARPTTPLISELGRLREPLIWATALCHTASFGILLAVSSWFPALLGGTLGFPDRVVGRWMAAFAIVGLTGRLAGAPVAARLGPQRHVGFTLAILAAALVGMAVALGRGLVVPVTLLALLIGGIANHPFSTLMTRAAAQDPGRAGSALGALNMIALSGAMILPVGFGWFKDQTGSFQASLLFFAAVAVGGALMSTQLQKGAIPAPATTVTYIDD